MLAVFPLSCPALKMAPAAKCEMKEKYSGPKISELATSFSFSIEVADKASYEWVDYQLDDECTYTDPVEFWCSSATVSAYPSLSAVMKTLLSIPHSNASCERVFSMLKKVSTDQRSLLLPDTVKAILRVKINTVGCCIDRDFSKKTLRALKKAAQDYNAKHQGAGASAVVDDDEDIAVVNVSESDSD